MQFSRRTAWDLNESDFSRGLREARLTGKNFVDLTVSNPTLCGFDYGEALLQGLSDARSRVYDPDPRGMAPAREAVADYYAAHHAQVSPDQILLTTSTSEAYSFLFRLLCDAGDSVMVAQPGYPLFDFLAALEDVSLKAYPLFYDFGWWIDFAELERSITPRTRALVLVHPNNPTGHATTAEERVRLQQLCAHHGLVLIVDEVFLDYGLAEPVQSFACGPHPCLTFVVSGLSKVCALPQMKFAWLAAFGPAPEVEQAMRRLEVVADTFLSMNAPVQLAASGWLSARGGIQSQILARVRRNAALVNDLCLPMDAGWCCILKLPWRPGEIAQRLMTEAAVLSHPGAFYGLAERNRVVISLLLPESVFADGIKMLKNWIDSSSLP